MVARSEVRVDLRGFHWLECVCLSEDPEKSLTKTHGTGMALSVYGFLWEAIEKGNQVPLMTQDGCSHVKLLP